MKRIRIIVIMLAALLLFQTRLNGQEQNVSEARTFIKELLEEKQYQKAVEFGEKALIQFSDASLNYKDYIYILTDLSEAYDRLGNYNLAYQRINKARLLIKDNMELSIKAYVYFLYCKKEFKTYTFKEWSLRMTYLLDVYRVLGTNDAELNRLFYKLANKCPNEESVTLDESLKLFQNAYEAINFDLFHSFFIYLQAKTKDHEALSSLNNGQSLLTDMVLYDYYDGQYRYYEMNGYPESAAIYLKKRLEIQSDIYQQLGLMSPWWQEHSINETYVDGYRDYTDLLFSTRNYQEIIEYSDKLLRDNKLNDYRPYDRALILSTKREALDSLGRIEEVSLIDKEISEFEKTISFKNRNSLFSKAINAYNKGDYGLTISLVCQALDEGWTPADYLSDTGDWIFDNDAYAMLFQCHAYDKLLLYAEKDLDTIKAIAKDEECWYPIDEAYSKTLCGEDILVANLRDMWHHANGCSNAWIAYRYMALASYGKKEYARAIEYQKQCLEIVCTDWKYDPEMRSQILESDDPTAFSIEHYIIPEVKMMYNLAVFYLANNEFDSCYEVLNDLIDLHLQAILRELTYGSDIIAEEKWQEWQTIFDDIVELIGDRIYPITTYDSKIGGYVDLEPYPLFSNIIFKISQIKNGFLLGRNQRLQSTAHYYNGAKSIQQYKEWCKTNRQIEELFMKGESSEVLITQRDKIQKELYDTYPILSPKELIKDICDLNISKNEVIVSFVPWNKCPKYNDGEEFDFTALPNGYSAYMFAAIICKKGWDIPKIVPLISSVKIFKYYNASSLEIEKDIISTLYSSTDLYDYFWKDVISEAELHPGDTIKYIPSNILNEIAMENALMPDNNYLYEQYIVKRYSSLSSIDNEPIIIKRDDYSVAFGNHSLPGSKIEINYLESIKTSIYFKYQEDASVEDFWNLESKVPTHLHIGTHGINYTNKTLDRESHKKYYGDRDVTNLTSSQRAMYTSGLLLRDKVLRAKDISMTDLYGCKLVVLSACSTGLGVYDAEGVYGLTRGLKMAGVSSLLVSLWDVDDNATALLMNEFYRQLFNGFEANTALAMAKQYVRNYTCDVDEYGVVYLDNEMIYQDPYFWAGFVLID